MQKEIWKDIAGFNNYQISNLGRVKSLSRTIFNGKGYFISKEKIMSLKYNTRQYAFIHLRVDGKSIPKRINRLVAESFIVNPENKKEVNHKNGIRNDNSVNNLEWVTTSENQLHSFRVLGRKSSTLGKCGKYHPASKQINQFNLNDEFIASYESLSDAERLTGINDGNISSAINGRLKTAGGYKWKFK